MVDIVKRRKGSTCALFRGIGKMLVWGSTFTQRVGGANGWCVVCIRKRVENGVMMVCEMTNGRCEL
jgi:hypothetical protein